MQRNGQIGAVSVGDLLDSGDVLNSKYGIERIIDRGGMGIVLGARHTLLHLPVAIKMLLPEFSTDAAFVARFLRETKTIASIESDHVVRVYDAGLTARGIPYLVMEWLDGMDLRTFARSMPSGVLDVALAVRCVREACEALGFAHDLGIVHRDVKPSNLFLSKRPNGEYRVKLIDFGICKRDGGFVVEDGELTRTGAMLGTIDYMAPEQIRSAHQVDRRADIWSLGVTLYRLITGRVPFGAKDPSAKSVSIFSVMPEAPSSLRPEIPLALDAIIAKCLEKDPANRFATMSELAWALASLESNAPTVALEPTPCTQRSPTASNAKPVNHHEPRSALRHSIWIGLSTSCAVAAFFVGVKARPAIPDCAKQLPIPLELPALQIAPPAAFETPVDTVESPVEHAPNPAPPPTHRAPLARVETLPTRLEPAREVSIHVEKPSERPAPKAEPMIETSLPVTIQEKPERYGFDNKPIVAP